MRKPVAFPVRFLLLAVLLAGSVSLYAPPARAGVPVGVAVSCDLGNLVVSWTNYGFDGFDLFINGAEIDLSAYATVTGPVFLSFPGPGTFTVVQTSNGGQFEYYRNTVECQSPPCSSDDGRENSLCDEPWQTAAIYCTPDGGVEVWGISPQGTGYPAFAMSPAQIKAVGVPESNKLIGSSADGQIRLYILAGGRELQVNAPMGSNINGYVFIWDGCGAMPAVDAKP